MSGPADYEPTPTERHLMSLLDEAKKSLASIKEDNKALRGVIQELLARKAERDSVQDSVQAALVEALQRCRYHMSHRLAFTSKYDEAVANGEVVAQAQAALEKAGVRA